MAKSRFLLFLLALFASFCAPLIAHAQNPVKWSAVLEPADIRAGEGGRVILRGRIEAPWYIYAPSTPPGGPNPTKIELLSSKTAKQSGTIVQPKARKHFDEGFQMNTETYSQSVSFSVPLQLQKGVQGAQKIKVSVRYQACNSRLCLPPKTVEVPVAFTVAAGPARPERLRPDTSVPPQLAQSSDAEKPSTASAGETAKNGASADEPQKMGEDAASSGLLAYMGIAFGAGFLALLTPCVFPMIPITVSFFTKRSEGQQTGISGPLAFCAGIIGTFTVVGVAASVAFGAAGIARFATNPYVNLALAALFVLLALNLFGVFEITVPSGILNRVSPSGKSGLLAPLLMGFAFTLTSFTCTVPFVGTALFAAATGGWIYPALGMLAFSSAFALPFFLLALFPGWMSKMPRAGSWLVSTKAFLGFLELAAALKFLSTVDLVWQLGYLTRPVFLALWFALALLAALYLLQIMRLPNDEPARPGPVRMGLGAAMIGVSVVLLSAMNGTRLGDFDAYLPPDDYGANAAPRVTQWLKNDLEGAQKLAREQNKPLLINFTGYACTNCRLMEKNVLPHGSVTQELENYVAVELYTDGTDAKSRQFNQFQQQKFGTVAIPLYAVVEPNGTIRGRLEGLERDPARFAAFLNRHSDASRVASTP